MAPTPPLPYLHHPTTIQPPLSITPEAPEDQRVGARTYAQRQHQQQYQRGISGGTMAAPTAAAATMVVATGTAAAGAGYYGPLPRLFLHFLSNIYMYIQYFNNNKPRVLKVPRVS